MANKLKMLKKLAGKYEKKIHYSHFYHLPDEENAIFLLADEKEVSILYLGDKNFCDRMGFPESSDVQYWSRRISWSDAELEEKVRLSIKMLREEQIIRAYRKVWITAYTLFLLFICVIALRFYAP